MTVFLPTAGQALADPGTGHITGPYRRWANALTEAVNAAQGGKIIVPPTPEYPDFAVNGSGSVTADGSVAGGEFVVALVGDKDSPPPNSFYGATTAGDKGFVPVYDALEEGTGIAIRDSGYIVIDTVETPDDLPLTGNADEAVRVTGAEPGLYAWDGAAFTIDMAADGSVSVALDTLSDSGAGTFKLLTRDAYGRLEGTKDGVAADVPYSNTTSGLTATQVQAAIDEIAARSVTGSWTTIKKTTDQTRNSTTTLSDDSQLNVSLAAATRYCIRARVFYSIANATMDFKYQWAYSGAVTSLNSHKLVYPAGLTSGTDNEFTLTETGSVGVSIPLSSAAGLGYFELDLILLTNSAGTLSLQWAQNTSDAGNCTVLAGSYLEYMTV